MSVPSREQLQRELAQARAELQDFTYSVSHDLRASLRHVTAYVQIIQEDLTELVDEEINSHLQTVSQAARHMGRQIDALTELSRLGSVEWQADVLETQALVDQVWAQVAPDPAQRTVVWQCAPDLPKTKGDAALVQQVLLQLLGNALKFSQSRETAYISLSWVVQSDGRCAITVQDNGVGFNPAHQDKLFHAFQRLHSASEFAGLGMGLAQVKKIVERHGGTVWAQGALDAGCRVNFTLPMAGAGD